MITSSVKELNETKAKVAQLEHALAKELASLPAAYGFDSLKAFVAAIKAAGGKGRVGRPKKSVAPKARKRAIITDAVRAQVKKLVKAGKTGSHIAKALGISLPSVQNIKKALGLVKSSKKPAPKLTARRASAKPKSAPKAKKKRVSPTKPAASSPKSTQMAAEPLRVPPA
jgi:hypothetical protein